MPVPKEVELYVCDGCGAEVLEEETRTGEAGGILCEGCHDDEEAFDAGSLAWDTPEPYPEE